MTAWQKLLAASQLLAGTAWELISNPKTGTGGGVIVNDGVEVEISQEAVIAEIEPMDIELELEETSVKVEVVTENIEVELESAPIEVEICE